MPDTDALVDAQVEIFSAVKQTIDSALPGLLAIAAAQGIQPICVMPFLTAPLATVLFFKARELTGDTVTVSGVTRGLATDFGATLAAIAAAEWKKDAAGLLTIFADSNADNAEEAAPCPL